MDYFGSKSRKLAKRSRTLLPPAAKASRLPFQVKTTGAVM